MPVNDVMYVITQFDYEKEGPKSALIFISWVPEEAPIKRKMLAASSQGPFKNGLQGITKSIQAGSFPELEVIGVAEKFKGTI